MLSTFKAQVFFPRFVLWEVWKQRNKSLFEEKKALDWVVAKKAIKYFKELYQEKK